MTATDGLQQLGELTGADRPGFYPDPSGEGTFLFWTGSRFVDAPEYIEQQIIAAIEPHLEKAYADGMKAGYALAQEAQDRAARAKGDAA